MQLAPVHAQVTSTIPFGPAKAAATAPAPAPPMPATKLQVPTAVEDALTAAIERGVRDASDWVAANPDATVEELQQFVLRSVGTPPTGAAADADHALVKAAVDARTPAQDETALWIDEHGLFPPWQPTIDSYVAKVGAGQAREGLALLERAKELTGLLTFPVKDHHMRPRPFQVHADTPLLPGLTHTRGGSFPSGHASLAYAQAIVLGSLLPDQMVDAKAMADQLAYSRPYAAAHYVSDITSGAYIGAVAATFAAARPDAKLPERQ